MQDFEFVNRFNDLLLGEKWEVNNPKAILILVTGMAEHAKRYDHFAKFLNEHDISIYSLDHYGQGKNGNLGNPGNDYFFKMVDTINNLSISLKKEYNLPIYLFSHSMGSFVSQGFIEKYGGGNFDKIVLCGSNGKTILFKLANLLAHIVVNKKNYNKEAKLLANLSIGAYEKAFKEESNNSWISKNKENVEIYDADPLSGFKCSNGFYYEFFRGLASLHNKNRLKNVSKNLKILIIGGNEDPVGNFGKGLEKLYKEYNKYNINARLILYPTLRHEILNEVEKDSVYKDIINFYEGN